MAASPKNAAPDLDAWLDAFVRHPAFLDKYPYYAAILGKLSPVADPSVDRMAVSLHDGRFFLHVNVDAFLREPQYLRGVLLHEVHHIVLGHLSHPKFANANEPELMDLALEMSANEFIEEPLPNPILHQAFAQIGIRAKQSTVDRYEKLLEAARQNPAQRRAGGSERDDPSRRVDDHRMLKRGERDPGAIEHTRQLLQNSIDDVVKNDPEQNDEDPRRRLLAGKNPGRLIEELTGTTQVAETFVDWKTAIKMFVAKSRAPVHTFSRPSRRFPDSIGIVPGRIYSPRVLARPSLLVAIDTSMSMTAHELGEVGRQLTKLAEHARVTVAECDTEITRTYGFDGLLDDVAGRGGTDLRPVFDPKFLGRMKTEGVVYFTDGEGPFPDSPPRVPVLWVLTKPREFGCPWGARSEMKLDRAAKKKSARHK
ncbi:MAG: VWA-like domain-containing protein [Polyangiaceae bacterium]